MNRIWEAINTGNLKILSEELGQVTKELKADNDKAELRKEFDHVFVGGYEIDPGNPATCQICGKRHAEGLKTVEQIINDARECLEISNDKAELRKEFARSDLAEIVCGMAARGDSYLKFPPTLEQWDVIVKAARAETKYTDAERLAAYEILLARLQIMLQGYVAETPSAFLQKLIDMIDEEMDK